MTSTIKPPRLPVKSNGPITPDEVGVAKHSVFPPEVFQAFNELIAAHFVGSSATFKQSDVLDRIAILMNVEFKSPQAGPAWSDKVIQKGWLNVEDAYRAAGWQVTYDKSGIGESYYPATFTFTKRA